MAAPVPESWHRTALRFWRRPPLRWSNLFFLYSGLFGKAIFIISIAAPFALFAAIDVVVSSYAWSLAGSVLIALGYAVNQLFIPSIFRNHETASLYARDTIDRSKENLVHFEAEFFILDSHPEPAIYLNNAGLPNNFVDYLPVEDGVKTLGDEKAAYYFSHWKYALVNFSNPLLLWLQFALLGAGVPMLYYPVIRNVFTFFTRIAP